MWYLESQEAQTMRPSLLANILREQRVLKSRILQVTTQLQLLLVEFC